MSILPHCAWGRVIKKYKPTNKLSTDINVRARNLSAHRAFKFTRSDACRVAFKDVGGCRLLVSKVTECFA